MSSVESKPVNPEASVSRFWRSIDELSQTPEVLEQLHREFPDVNSQKLSGISRRQFTRLMAASMALAGVGTGGCRRWPEQLVRPRSARTEDFLPGVPEYFATHFELQGAATGLLAKSVDGRPVKIEGNDLHPFSHGAAGVFAQASILELYDPERTRGYMYRASNAPVTNGQPAGNEGVRRYSKEFFQNTLQGHFAVLRQRQGRGLHVLTQSDSSPTLARLRQEFQVAFPEARWHVYQPLDRDQEYAGSRLAFNKVVRPQFQLRNASTIVCFDSDLLGSHPGHQKWCRDWAAGRNPKSADFNRLWAFESGYSITGAAADIRQTVLPSQMLTLIRAVASGLGMATKEVQLDHDLQDRVNQLTAELRKSASTSLLVAGRSQPPEVHAWIHAIHQRLGCVGKTVRYTDEPLAEDKSCVDSLAELASAVQGGSAETLLILGGNPLYDHPADISLELNSRRRLTSIHLGLFDNETARQCTWHVPAAHYLESWSDGRAWGGTYSVGQPLIYPLFDGVSTIEMLSFAMGQAVNNGMELVRETARGQFGIGDDKQWKKVLHDGFLPESAFANVAVPSVNLPITRETRSEASGFEICFVHDFSTLDGRFANNGWLQELPDPLTKLTWDNAALISKKDADRHGLGNGDEIRIEWDGDRQLEGVPVLIQPGQMPGTISLAVGYGRQTGHIASNVGFNVYPVRTSCERYVARGGRITRTGKHQQLSCTQEHHLVDAVGMAGRRTRVGERAKPGTLVRETTLDEHRNNPHAVHEAFHVPKTAPMFDPPHDFNSPSAWGMAIDLNTCMGCNACVVACQSENNIPIVGKANVFQNREMHWLRIDRYFKGDVDSPDVVHVPVACAQCQDAPCEQVCPVAATVHDTEGLNAMVYNRCVGTRYCANNCPYKVRRFNYFDYHAKDPRSPVKPWLDIPDRQSGDEIPELKQMAFNPEVSVRMRGVMEKCTYCVQRISVARIDARNEYAKGRRESALLQDGEVVTACQQACPTAAIRFGDLNDKKSDVSLAHGDVRAYAMLEETNIKPRTRFLAKVRNVDDASTHER